MPDMLVRLYDLPPCEPVVAHCKALDVTICQPINCVIATEKGRVIGFATHDATARGFFGPTGVLASHRSRGIGKALLIASLHALAELEFAYAVIDQAGEAARNFYAKSVGATIIPGSDPSIYRDWLSSPKT